MVSKIEFYGRDRMFPPDIIGVIYNNIPDVRGSALTCKCWYEVYTHTDDYAYWTCGRAGKHIMVKMILDVWDGSICDLIRTDASVEVIIAALDHARQNCLYYTISQVISAAVGDAVKADRVDVAEFLYWQFGVFRVEIAQAYGAIKCLEYYISCGLEDRFTVAGAGCYNDQYVYWVTRRYPPDHQFVIACMNSGYMPRELIKSRAVDYAVLRHPTSILDYLEIHGGTPPPLEDVMHLWSLKYVRRYLDMFRPTVNAELLGSAARSADFTELFRWLYELCDDAARDQIRGIAAESCIINSIEDIKFFDGYQFQLPFVICDVKFAKYLVTNHLDVVKKYVRMIPCSRKITRMFADAGIDVQHVRSCPAATLDDLQFRMSCERCGKSPIIVEDLFIVYRSLRGSRAEKIHQMVSAGIDEETAKLCSWIV
jgi:hypothetical protein